jgi:hypothetical protein
MKNIHVLPTDKPSRLSDCHNNKLHLDDVRYLRNYQNIYITSDEEIKDGEYCITKTNEVIKFKKSYTQGFLYKKIILTTDQDLIKDGVQAIDDEFLEWFVTNANESGVPFDRCEVKHIIKEYVDEQDAYGYDVDYWKIIIPQEESKQETFEEAAKDFIENTMKYSFNSLETKTFANRLLKSVEFGTKWQAERMYSEEDMDNYAEYCINHFAKSQIGQPYLSAKEWFEQFKKK